MAKISISQAWDETRAILARDGKLISTVALALLVLPGVIVSVLGPRGSDVTQTQRMLWLIPGFIALLVTFVGQLSIIRLAMGPHIAVGEAIRHAVRRVPPFIVAFLIWMLPLLLLGAIPYGLIRNNPGSSQTVAGLGLLALMGVGLLIAVRLMLIGPVASAENRGSLAILRRSWDLTQGNWWRLFGFLLIFALGAVVLLYATSAAVGLLARLLVGPISSLSVGGLIVIIVAQLVTAAIYVVLFVMQTRIYLQLAGDRGAAETFR